MKKILFILAILLFLFSCDNKGCNNEVVEFTHSGILTFYLDEIPNDVLKTVKLKVTNKGKETVLGLDDKVIKVRDFKFDQVGDYVALVEYKNNTYRLKYKVEMRKWDGKTDTSWYKDNINTFELKTANELAGLADLVNKGNDFENRTIKLKYDIDLNNLPWIPIGTNGKGKQDELDKFFMGNFDGNNKTIYNLYTEAKHEKQNEHLEEASSYYHFGLFGYVKNSILKNVKFQNVKIVNGMTNGYVRSFQGTGALVGYANGEVVIDNVKVLGNILIKGEYKVGGIIGSCSGSSIYVKNCVIRGVKNSFIGGTDAEYKDTNNYGGLIGFSSTSKTTIENVISDIDVDGFTSGGIIGNVTEGSLEIKNACVYGNISNKEGSVVGGFVGGRFVSMVLNHCYLVGSVTSLDKSYADIIVSKYGDTGEVISVNEVYYNSNNYDSEKVNNTLNVTGLTIDELNNKIPEELK